MPRSNMKQTFCLVCAEINNMYKLVVKSVKVYTSVTVLIELQYLVLAVENSDKQPNNDTLFLYHNGLTGEVEVFQ